MTDMHTELELAQRYAAGRLDAGTTATFEEHLVVCERCQDEVRLTAGLRKVMRAPAAKSSRGQWVAVGAVLLAAGIVGLLVMPARVDRRVAALGQVTEPPAYVGMSVRGLRGRADSLFDAAMTAYLAHRYDAAASGLRAALAAGVDSVPAEFFLASAELMDGHPQAAADTYARVIAVGSAAAGYLPEAHLYRGRALLQLGRTQDAVAELKAVDASDPASAKAAALLDSVTRVLKR